MSPTTVVCLHGLGRSAADWEGVRDDLARYGPVAAVALPRGGARAMLAATADLPAPAVLVGHSMAGPLVLRRAAVMPDRVAAVVLTGSFFPPARGGRTLAATTRDYAAHRVAVLRDLRARRARPRPGADGARGVASLAWLGLRPGAFHALARAVPAPVLVVHAADDHYVPLEFARAAAAHHPAWSLRVLPSGGHAAHVVRPDAWLGAVTPWLDGVLGSGVPGVR